MAAVSVQPLPLAFAVAEPSSLERLRDYLTRVGPKWIELFAPHALPDAILSVAYALAVPVHLALGDVDWICDRDLAFARSCPDNAFPGQCECASCRRRRPLQPTRVAELTIGVERARR